VGWRPGTIRLAIVNGGTYQWLWTHMADISSKTKGVVTEWDTINHIVAWGNHTYEKEYGGLEILGEIMAEGRRLAPGAKHAINEGKYSSTW
jgi:endo-1,4-beta-xylanase